MTKYKFMKSYGVTRLSYIFVIVKKTYLNNVNTIINRQPTS